MSLNKYMHPRNPYKYQKPDFKTLASKYPEFCEKVHDTGGKVLLDFKDPEALRILTKTLLKEDFDLDVELPQDRLVPTIPLRLNYLLWIEDIVGKKKMGVKGIDIGTGASCVYPLLGNKTNKWTFLATDIDAQNVFYAKKNVEKNNLTSAITVKKVTADALITGAVLDEGSETSYDFCMCNPPFFADHMEAQAISTSRSVDRPEPTSVSTASPKESIAMGGEVAFVKQMITDSVALGKRVRVYTTMLGKKTSIPPLKKELRRMQVTKYATTEFCQGKTMRWGLAWTFDENVVFPKSPFQSSKNEKPPLTYKVPYGAGGSIYDVPSLTTHIKTLLEDLKIQFKEKKCHKGFSCLLSVAYENTWSNQRRKRRQKKREEKSKEEKDNPELLVPGKGDSSKDDSGVADITDNSMETEVKEVSTDEKGGNSSAHDTPKVTSVDSESNLELCKTAEVGESGDRKRKAEPDESVGNKRVKVAEKEDRTPAGTESDVVIKEGDGTEIEDNSGNTKRESELHESNDGKRLEVAETFAADVQKEEAEIECKTNQESHSEIQPGPSKPRRYILKCEVNLIKPAGVREITLQVVWRDGEKREYMHQVMQFLKNNLQAPC